MRISARCDYACRAILELSLHWPSKSPMTISEISRRQGIPIRYLIQILIQLKRAGLVNSVRGKEGGYNLLRPPEELTLHEIVTLVGGDLLPVAESAKNKDSVFSFVWAEVKGVMGDVLKKVTFKDIVEKEKGHNKALVYYI